MTEKEFNLLPNDEKLRLVNLIQTDFRQYLLETGHATDEQIATLREAGYSGGGLFIYTVEQANKEIEKLSVKHTDRQEKINIVRCWECGSEVNINKATFDGNGWYCGC